MKPTIKGVILIAMLFALLSCSVNQPDIAATQTPVPTRQIQPTVNPTQTEELKPLICIIVPNVDNPYFGSMQEIAARKAEELGYTVLKLVHEDDAMRQSEQFDTCIVQHAVAIILINAVADASIVSIQKAKEAGIPSFLIEREISMEGVAVSQIVPNQYQGATLLAEEFARLMGEEGEYIELTGMDTDPNAHVRSDGFHTVLDARPEMKMVAQHVFGWTADEFSPLESLLPEHPNVRGVICENDDRGASLVAQTTLNAAGRSDVIVAGFGGSDNETSSILDGEIDAGILPPVAEMATMAVIQADRYLRTGSTGLLEKQSIDMILLTPENACQYTAFAPNGKTSCP